MRCLFVRAPFAGWIVDGVKTIEYRTRPTHIRGTIGIIQSKSGTVIGTVEIVGCEWNEMLDHYEWKLTNGERFATPLPYRPKTGAVVWIDAEVPGKRPAAPKLSAAEQRKQKKEYEEAIAAWLHPEKVKTVFMVILKDGSHKEFKSEEEMDDFASNHAKIVDHCEIVS